MKINYKKIRKCAIVPINGYNLQELIVAFVYDGKLPITVDYIHSSDLELYDKWCFFCNKIRKYYDKYKNRFAIALEPLSLEGCVYGDASDLAKQGYKIISLTNALEELPNVCTILGVTPDEFLETHGLIERDKFSPHYITLDGLIRAKNGGCISLEEVLDLLKKVGFITNDHNGLYDLFGLTSEDSFKIKGYTYDKLSSNNNFTELMTVCKTNVSLIYKLINNPDIIQKIETLDEIPRLK